MNNHFDILDEFLKNKSQKDKIIVVYWPTACWKTSLWIEIAKKINSEIISTDSRQIFKYLNIWTWKVTQKEMFWIKHHMIDIIDPNINYSVWEYKKQSEKYIDYLISIWKIPILVWWTWLYIDSLIYDFDIPEVPASLELREKFEKEAIIYGKQFVYNKLVEIDSDYAKELHPNNLNYVIRALEIKILTWFSKKDFRKEKTLKYDTLFLTPYDNNRELLYEKINYRVQEMFDNWLIDEVKNILNIGFKQDDFWLKSIWYTEVIDYLNGNISLDDCINLVKQHNRNYAKRQLTWFNKYSNF